MEKSATSATTLQRVIRDLQKQRDKHMSAIADIDAAFKAYGIKTDKARKGSGKKAPAKKKRGRFNKTAEQFITDLLNLAGQFFLQLLEFIAGFADVRRCIF